MSDIDYSFYELKRIDVKKHKDGDFVLVNASIGSCGLCGEIITGMGGSNNMVCIDCGDMLQRGQLKTCVVREGK